MKEEFSFICKYRISKKYNFIYLQKINPAKFLMENTHFRI